MTTVERRRLATHQAEGVILQGKKGILVWCQVESQTLQLNCDSLIAYYVTQSIHNILRKGCVLAQTERKQLSLGNTPSLSKLWTLRRAMCLSPKTNANLTRNFQGYEYSENISDFFFLLRKRCNISNWVGVLWFSSGWRYKNKTYREAIKRLANSLANGMERTPQEGGNPGLIMTAFLV